MPSNPYQNKRRKKVARARRAQILNDWRAQRGDTCEWLVCRRQGSHAHHKDPSTKLFDIGSNKGLSRNFTALIAELAKCVWLCKGHHHQAEANIFLGDPNPWDSHD